MIRVDCLFVGDATDGPVDEFVHITSLDQAWRLFGGYIYEYTTVSSGQTSYTLANVPWGGEVTPLKADTDGTLIPQRLFEFSVSGQVVSWTSLGYSTQVIFRYSIVPGNTSVLKGILSAKTLPTDTFVVRVGGTPATTPIGNFRISSKYAGNRYNGIQLSITSGGVVTITPSGGVGKGRTYNASTDLSLATTLQDETLKGNQGIYLTGALSNTSLTIPAGTYTLTGGTDGQFTSDSFLDFVSTQDLDGVDIVCPVGLLTTEISGVGALSVVEQNNYPTLLIVQAPPSGIALSGIVVSSKNLVSVAFKTTYDLGLPKSRVDDAAPLVAAIIGNNIFNVTLAPLTQSPPTPQYDQQSLHILSASGYTTSFKSISRDWALWYVPTGDPMWPVSQFRSLQEVARVVFDTLEPVIGNTLVDQSGIDNLLGQGFTNLVGSRVVDWQLVLQGDILYLDLDFIPYGEIRTVNVQLAVGQTSAVSPT